MTGMSERGRNILAPPPENSRSARGQSDANVKYHGERRRGTLGPRPDVEQRWPPGGAVAHSATNISLPCMNTASTRQPPAFPFMLMRDGVVRDAVVFQILKKAKDSFGARLLLSRRCCEKGILELKGKWSGTFVESAGALMSASCLAPFRLVE